MKKSIIAAGAASAVLAAMPVMGVFADDITTQTDIIKVKVSSTCTFNSVTHSNGAADPAEGGTAPSSDTTVTAGWTNGSPDATVDTLQGVMANGTYTNNYGSTTFQITCNKFNGFTVATSFPTQNEGDYDETTNPYVTDLIGSTSSNEEVIPLSNTISAANSAWSYKVSTPAETLTAAGLSTGAGSWQNGAATIISGAAPVHAAEFAVTYGMAVDDTQAADTYEGRIIYTLAQN